LLAYLGLGKIQVLYIEGDSPDWTIMLDGHPHCVPLILWESRRNPFWRGEELVSSPLQAGCKILPIIYIELTWRNRQTSPTPGGIVATEGISLDGFAIRVTSVHFANPIPHRPQVLKQTGPSQEKCEAYQWGQGPLANW